MSKKQKRTKSVIVKDLGLIIFFGFLICILGLVLRLVNLTILPVFADEAIYIRWAQIMGNEPTLRFLPLSDGKQPLFMWILMFLVRHFDDALFIGRLVSVFSGIGTIVGIICLSYSLFRSRLASLMAGLFWAVSPFSLFFDRMALVDSLLVFFGVWFAFWAFWSVRLVRLDLFMISGFFLGGSLLTKSPSLFYVLLFPSILLFVRLAHLRRPFYIIKLLFFAGVALVIGYGMFNVLRLGPNFHLLGTRNRDYVFPIAHLWENPRDPFIFHFDRAWEWIEIMGPSTIILFFVGGIIKNIRKFPRETLFLLAWFLFPILVQSEFAKVFTARYILFTIPFLFILAASLFANISRRLLFLSSFLLFFWLWTAFRFDFLLLTDPASAALPRGERSGYLEEWTAGTGIFEVAEYIKQEHTKNPQSPIVVGTEGYFGTLPDGLMIYLTNVSNVDVFGVGLDLGEVPSSLRDSVKAQNKTYLVINSSRLKIEDLEKAGLVPILAFPKAERPNWTHEYVVHGPRETLYLFEVTDEVID